MVLKNFNKYIFNLFRKYKINDQHLSENYQLWASKNYNFTPKISFIIQTHNRADNVLLIINILRRWKDSEIIIIDDGSENKQSKILLKSIYKSNEFYIKANDLYEVITYDRAI
jgi:hypothetical protein